MHEFLSQLWYSKKIPWFCWLLWPFSLLFYLAQRLRFFLYRIGIYKIHHFDVPIIVVLNKVVGGAGKTPAAMALLLALKKAGYYPGLVTRGYGGGKRLEPLWVTLESHPAEVGDEPVLIASRCDCPVVVCRDRVQAVRYLLARAPQCDVIVSDDGGLHYAMGRRVEIMVEDKMRGDHNGYYLPLGPLRDPNHNQACASIQVDHVLELAEKRSKAQMKLQPSRFYRLSDQQEIAIDAWPYPTVHAVAGIGHPQRFFAALQRLNIQVIPHVFPDHHLYSEKDFSALKNSPYPIVMTAKDAVKCKAFALPAAWYLEVEAIFSLEVMERVIEGIRFARDNF